MCYMECYIYVPSWIFEFLNDKKVALPGFFIRKICEYNNKSWKKLAAIYRENFPNYMTLLWIYVFIAAILSAILTCVNDAKVASHRFLIRTDGY